MQLKLPTVLLNMRYDDIKVGPCKIAGIRVDFDTKDGHPIAVSSFKDNKSVLDVLTLELDTAHSPRKHRIMGSRRNFKFDIQGLSTDTDVIIYVEGDENSPCTEKLETAVDSCGVEAYGYYSFAGIEAKSVEADTGTYVMYFNIVKVELVGKAMGKGILQ